MFAGGGERQFIAYDAATGERHLAFHGADRRGGGTDLPRDRRRAVRRGRGGRGLQPYYQPNYSRLLAFKLGGTAELPPMLDYTPPRSIRRRALRPRGAHTPRRSMVENFVQCHGNTIGTFPDLRVSAIKSQELFDAIVLKGARAANGMVLFASQVTPTTRARYAST